MTTLQKPLKEYMMCSLYASVQSIEISPFLPHGRCMVYSCIIMLMYGKEASNGKQEIDRQHHTIPNQRKQRPKDKHYGNVHNRLWITLFVGRGKAKEQLYTTPVVDRPYTMRQSTHGVTGISGGKGKYPLNTSPKKSFTHSVQQINIL